MTKVIIDALSEVPALKPKIGNWYEYGSIIYILACVESHAVLVSTCGTFFATPVWYDSDDLTDDEFNKVCVGKQDEFKLIEEVQITIKK